MWAFIFSRSEGESGRTNDAVIKAGAKIQHHSSLLRSNTQSPPPPCSWPFICIEGRKQHERFGCSTTTDPQLPQNKYFHVLHIYVYRFSTLGFLKYIKLKCVLLCVRLSVYYILPYQCITLLA